MNSRFLRLRRPRGYPFRPRTIAGGKGLLFPHTLDATRQLCSTAVCWGADLRESSFRTAGRGRACGTLGSILRLAAWPPLSGLMLAATNVLFLHRSLADHSWCAETEACAIVAAENRGSFRDFCGQAALSNATNEGRKPSVLNKFIWSRLWN